MPITLAEVLRNHRSSVLDEWTHRVLDDPRVPEANRLSTPALHDRIPDILDRIVAMLMANGAAGADEGRAIGAVEPAREHARHRFDEQYRLDGALRELSHLRGAILTVCDREGVRLDGARAQLLHAAIDELMSTSALEMARAARTAETIERERLRAVLQLLPVGVVLSDAQGTLLEANPAAERLWGISPLPRLGRDEYGLFKGWHAATGAPMTIESWALVRALRKGEAATEQEVDIEGFDGVRRTIVNSGAPIRDASGRIVGGVAVNVDITERKRVERELRREAELRERTMGILGHDLRSPLASITFGASALLRRKDLPEAARKTIERIASSAEHMTRMIDDLLDLTRIRSGGGLPIHPRATDLLTIGRRVTGDLASQHPERAIHFRHRGNLQGVWDPDRLHQVLSNLAGNAVDHSPGDAPLRVAMWSEGDEVILEVHNEGPPIPPALLPLLFDPFRRATHATVGRASRGLGLGLHIVDQIVRAHGGSIGVHSTDGEGTTFTVRLPRSGGGQAPPPAP